MKFISQNVTANPIPSDWETLRPKISHEAGRHAVIAGGAVRDHILGLTVKDIDIFVLGMTAEAAQDIFNADIFEYAGVEEARAEYPSLNGVPVDLVFSQHSNVYDVLDHFDLGICRVAWDGEFMLTDDFANDLGKRTITSFYPSPRGHGKRVLDKLAPLGFHMGESVVKDDYVARLRERAERRGYRLMHRRNGQYWLMRHQPMTLHEVADFLYA
jgi:Poly A polymerase head domain